jgi:hypothetical protein
MYCTMVLPYPATLAKLLVGYGKRRAGGGACIFLSGIFCKMDSPDNLKSFFQCTVVQ